jgi:hypothetical protein
VAKNKKKSTLINSKHMIRKGKREQMENMLMNLQKCGRNYRMKMKKNKDKLCVCPKPNPTKLKRGHCQLK